MSATVKPDDVWIRLRHQPWRVRDGRASPRWVSLRMAFKTLGRWFGWGVMESFEAGDQPGPLDAHCATQEGISHD